MATDYVLVPMFMDIIVLNQEADASTPFSRFQMNYTNLQSFESPEPVPFTGAAVTQPTAGIYLHWTLPAALRHGINNQDGSTDFPLVPNRWLVVRIQGGAAPAQAVKAWILESDYIDPQGGTNPFVDPTGLSSNGVPIPTQIGRALLFPSDVQSLTAANPLFLTAVGAGSETFSVYSPGVQNVFAFYDTMTANDNQTPIAQGTFSYYVAGWYSDPSADPLATTTWAANTDPNLPGTYVNSKFDWYVYAASAALPTQTLLHTLISSVPWDSGADNPAPQNYPSDLQTNVKVALGNTAIDALAGIVRLNRPNEPNETPANLATEADMLEAFQYDLLGQFDVAGSCEALNMAIRQHWYGASPGGLRWTITAGEQIGPTSLPAPPMPPITPAQQAALAALNAQQTELDRQQRILESMQWNLYGLWWKYNWQNQNNPPVSGQLVAWLAAQLPLQLGIGSTCTEPIGVDPSQQSWYLCKVQAQQNLVAQLQTQTSAAQKQLDALLDPNTQELTSVNKPQYYFPNDPVLLVTNLGRSTNFDPTDGVLCRLASQTVNTLTVSSTTYCIDGSCGANVQGDVPVLSDPNSLLPSGIQQLNTEVFFLSPDLFAQGVLGGSSQDSAVQQAINSLPAPPAAVQFPPVGYAMEVWEQPWVPLLLEWQITVLKEPAYTCTQGQPTATFNQNNWQFDGTNYQWIGTTTPGNGNFDEADSAQMMLTGRTFITPQIAFTLADQLEAYVQTHKLRDPQLEALLEDLDQYLESIKGQDILSQRLSGAMAMMIERNTTQNVAPSGNITTALGDSRHGYPLPFPLQIAQYDPAPWDFAPMRGTFFVINQLRVLDTFGRAVNLMLANYSTDPQTQGNIAEDYFYPIAGRDLQSPTGLPPAPGQGISSDPTQRMLQLTPRLNQDSQLAFQLTSNDGQNNNIYEAAGANPICGWVVPNHLDRSLAFYAPNGQAWGEAYLSQHAANLYVPVWQPDPTNPQAPQTIEAIPNTYISALLQALFARTDDGIGFADFMQTIDETLWTINPSSQRADLNLSVLIGRPLAIVRAALSLKLRGLPVYNQDWQNTFSSANSNGANPTPIGTVDGGISNFLWPVRLGSAALRNDGVIGYYLDNPTTPANTFQVFNAVTVPADVQTNYLQQIGQNNDFVQLRVSDDSIAATNLDPTQNQVCYVTLLVDPRGSMHAFSGLLPVVNLEIPAQFITPALQTMYYTFRVGPFLTSPEEVRIPRLAAHQGSWTWFDNVLDATVSFAPADDKVRFPVTPPLIKEGWLKFTPNPSGDDQ